MTRPHLSPAPGVVRGLLRYATPDGEQLNTFYFFKETAWTSTDLVTCASQLLNWESVSAADIRADSVALIEVIVTDLTTATSGMRALAPDSPIAGHDRGEYLPGNVTLAVQCSTGNRGTGRQGRIYWIGLTVPMIIGSQINPDQATRIVNSLQQLNHNMSGATSAQMCVLHRTQDGVTLNPAQHELVQSFVVRDLNLDTQVNRLPGRSRPSHRR